MKKIFRVLATIIAFFAMAAPAFAQQESIISFDVAAALNANRTLTITETIQYDFGDNDRHGIYRVIPEIYDRNGAKYRLQLHFTDATMDGQPIPWSVSQNGDNEEIKIGDPDKTITGPHTYVITYDTARAINDFSDHQELYWNVTGNDWQVMIGPPTFHLTAPGAATKLACYTGPYGDTASDCSVSSTGNTVAASSSRPLDPGEGMTVVVAFPLGTVRSLTLMEKVSDFVNANLPLFFPVLVFIAMFAVWWKWGKEPRGRGTIIAQYEEPNGLTPALMSSLMDQNASQRATTATILDLARRGFLKIKFSGDPAKSGWFQQAPKFTLVRIKNTTEDVLPYEETLFNGLFKSKDEVTLEDLKGTYWKSLQDARKQIFDELRSRNLFGQNPSVVRAGWITGAVIVGFLAIQFAGVFGAAFIASGVVSAIIIAAFGWQMPRMTKAGAVAVEEIKGFKLFLSVTEQARLAFTDAPERTPEQFERFLPAAVAFGVEKKWAGQFQSIEMKPPSYFEGNASGWNAVYFANAVGQLHAASAATLYPAPSSAGSGGSGFSGGGSGGGFGGGGGGSW